MNLMFKEGNDEAALREYETARRSEPGKFLADGRVRLRLQHRPRPDSAPAGANG